MALTVLAAGSAGCVSLEMPDANATRPHVLGWKCVTNIAVTGGTLCRIRAPGLSLRLDSYAPGLTLGWHETLLFYPQPDAQHSNPPPAAVRTRSYGIGLLPFGIALGAESSFGIFAPAPGSSFVQTIVFDSNRITNTIIRKEEMP